MGWIFRCKGINLLDNRHDAEAFTQSAYYQHRLVHVLFFAFQAHSTCYLEVGKAINLCFTQEFFIESVDVSALQSLINVDDMLEFIEEPTVNLRQIMYLINGITLVHSLRNDEDTLVSRLTERCIKVGNLQLFVLNKAVHALSYHT